MRKVLKLAVFLGAIGFFLLSFQCFRSYSRVETRSNNEAQSSGGGAQSSGGGSQSSPIDQKISDALQSFQVFVKGSDSTRLFSLAEEIAIANSKLYAPLEGFWINRQGSNAMIYHFLWNGSYQNYRCAGGNGHSYASELQKNYPSGGGFAPYVFHNNELTIIRPNSSGTLYFTFDGNADTFIQGSNVYYRFDSKNYNGGFTSEGFPDCAIVAP